MFGSPLAVSALPLLALTLSSAAPPEDEEQDEAPVELPIGVDTKADHIGGPRVLAAEAFESGRAAFDAGRYPEAIEHFERAQSFVPHPDTQYNLGVALLRDQQAVRAWLLFEELAREAKDSQIREDARQQLQAAERDIALLRVMAPSDAEVCIDGELIDDAPRLRRVPLEPGPHVVVVHHRSTALELAAGELRVVHIDADPPHAQPHRPAVLGLLGAGAAGSAAALGLSIGAARASSESKRQGFAVGAASAAAVGLIGSAAALALHMRKRPAAAPGSTTTPGPCELWETSPAKAD